MNYPDQDGRKHRASGLASLLLAALALAGCGVSNQTLISNSPSDRPESSAQGAGAQNDQLGSTRLNDLPVAVDGVGRGPHQGLELSGASPFVNAFLGPKIAVRGQNILYTRTAELVDMSWQGLPENDIPNNAIETPDPDAYIILPEVVLKTPAGERTLDTGFAGAIRSDGVIAYGSMLDKKGMKMFGTPAADLVVADRTGDNPQTWASGGSWLPVLWVGETLLAYNLSRDPLEAVSLHAFEGPGRSRHLEGFLVTGLPGKRVVLATHDSEGNSNRITTYDLRTNSEIDAMELPFYISERYGTRTPSGTVFTSSNDKLVIFDVGPSGKIARDSLTTVALPETSEAGSRAIDFISPHPNGKTALLISYDQAIPEAKGEIYECSITACTMLDAVESMIGFSFLDGTSQY